MSSELPPGGPIYQRELVGTPLANSLVGYASEAITKSCLNCWRSERTDPHTLICKKFNAKPPLHVIVNACPEWIDPDNEIPF